MKLAHTINFKVGKRIPSEPSITMNREVDLESYGQLRLILRFIDAILKRKAKTP